MRRSNHMTSRGGSGHPPRHQGQDSHRGQHNTHRASASFNSYDEGSSMEQGMAPYDSSNEDRERESDMMHRHSRGREDPYRQSRFDGRESDEDAELLARHSGGNEYRPYGSENGRSDPFHSGPVRRLPTRRGPTSFGHDDGEGGRRRSNRESRDSGSRVQPFDSRGHGRREEYGNRSAEGSAEEDRRWRPLEPGRTVLGHWTQDDPEAAPIFTANPNLDSRYASAIERQRNLIRER